MVFFLLLLLLQMNLLFNKYSLKASKYIISISKIKSLVNSTHSIFFLLYTHLATVLLFLEFYGNSTKFSTIYLDTKKKKWKNCKIGAKHIVSMQFNLIDRIMNEWMNEIARRLILCFKPNTSYRCTVKKIIE